MWAIGEGQSDDWKIVDDYTIELKKLSTNFEVAVPPEPFAMKVAH